MLAEFLDNACQIVARYGANPAAASETLNDLYGSALKVYGVGRVVVVSPAQVLLTLRGKAQPCAAKWFEVGPRTIDLWLNRLNGTASDTAADELRHVLQQVVPGGEGAHVWIVPDGYMAALSESEKRWEREGVGYFSHEALCVQNTAAASSRCELFIYFEAPHEVLRQAFEVPAQRSIHLRLDKLVGAGSAALIPKSTPVGYKVVSYDVPVVVQGSRILTSGQGSEFASFGTTMAWTPQ